MAVKATGFELLTAGRYEEALSAFQTQYAQRRSDGVLNNVGFSQLALRRFDEARDTFDQVLSRHRDWGSQFGHCGVVRWIQGDRLAAVKLWEEGLEATYQDAAGGLQLPLLLYFAGVRAPDVTSASGARDVLAARANDIRAAGQWPTPIAQFLVGSKTLEALRTTSAASDAGSEVRRSALVEFYAAVRALESRDQEAWKRGVGACAANRGAEQVNEWHLARAEAASSGS